MDKVKTRGDKRVTISARDVDDIKGVALESFNFYWGLLLPQKYLPRFIPV